MKLLPILVLPLFLAGCSGDLRWETPQYPQAPLTPAQKVWERRHKAEQAKVDLICAELDTTIDPVQHDKLEAELLDAEHVLNADGG